MWDESEELLGGSIDIFCNNAGVPWQVNLLTGLGHRLNHGHYNGIHITRGNRAIDPQ